MPKWAPTDEWKGEDVYVIGGGPSLHNFDWSLLRDKKTIGCNSAFSLGSDVVDIILFGDFLWWEKIGKKHLDGFGGRVVSCAPRSIKLFKDHPYVLAVQRNNIRALGTEMIYWCGNTGGAAINLALILGAQRVFLLGFDMSLGERDGKPKANWHDLRYEPPKDHVYKRFLREFKNIPRTLPIHFPGREIINVTDKSNLDCFPKISLVEHFQTETQNV